MDASRPFDVFISYATPDLEFAQSVKRAIQNLGLKPFLAASTLAAGDRLARIQKHIQRARLVVVLWSESSSKSEWVRDELGAAWGAGVPVIPVLLTEGLDLPPSLRSSGVKYLDATKRDTSSVLDLQATVIAWWRAFLARHQAQQQAIMEETRRREQEESTKNLLGLVATSAVLYALSKGDK